MSKTAIDLYSGIGGWTLGMKLSGIENIASFEWWNEANLTHNLNFRTNHKEVNIRNIDVKKDLEFGQKIDFVVGSPPCTQFSYANKGGNGNIADGLIDIYKFLEVVDYLKPKYWAMENVPRVAGIIERELLIGGQLNKFRHLFSTITVVDASEYGVPQSRKRMIAGNFPFDLFILYKSRTPKLTLGEVLENLSREKTIIDPNYDIHLSKEELTDNEREQDLSSEEERINRESKTFHAVYNNMSFPERRDRPSRTITATCTRVSRESLIIESETGFRRLSVRERGVLQGFPITYQFYGKSINSKFKMIGNAVPPILTYYIFQSMLGTPVDSIKSPAFSNYKHPVPSTPIFISKFDKPTLKFGLQRKFMFAVPNLRFGSGLRFELSNSFIGSEPVWSFKFFYGNSKSIKNLHLDSTLFEVIYPVLSKKDQDILNSAILKIQADYPSINSKKLQASWISKGKENHPFAFIDTIGTQVALLDKLLALNFDLSSILSSILCEENKKANLNSRKFLIGFLLLSKINTLILTEQQYENRSNVLSLEWV